MLSEHGFQGVLEKCEFKNKKGENVFQLKISHKDTTGSNSFLRGVRPNFRQAFESDVDSFGYKDLVIPVSVDIDGEISFEGKVQSVVVKKQQKAGVLSYAYSVILEKEVGANNEDAILAHYVKKHEYDENGKKQTIPLTFTMQVIA